MIHLTRTGVLAFAVLTASAASSGVYAEPVAADPPALSLPIDCTPGTDCVIQQYVDHGSGPDAQDYRCGSQSYNNHTGTDIRLPDFTAMGRGIDVLAAAPGLVAAVRDGMPDAFREDMPESALEGRGCGNGVLLDHGAGWQTQYCHLKQGSISVGQGDTLDTGAKIGLVGLSGNTDFVHLEFVLRHKGQVIDPFTGSAPDGGCGIETASLWAPAVRNQLAYRDTLILNIGLADGPVTGDDVERGSYAAFEPTSDSPALVLYGRMINAQTADALHLTLKGPDGLEVDRTADAAPNPQAQRFAFAGKRRPAGGWPAGAYQGSVRVIRNGDTVDAKVLSFTIR